jgi:signal transduction histidine kinase
LIVRFSELRISSRAMLVYSLLGLFILFDLALFGWLIFRSLSEREIQRVLLDTREQAQGLAEQIAERAAVGDRDLYTAVASEQETLSYIDSILQQRDVVQTLEIRDRDGVLVYRTYTEASVPAEGGELLPFRESEVPPQIDQRTSQNESTFDLESSPFDINIPIAELGFVHVGISQGQLEQRIAVLRGDLVRLVTAIGAVTLALLTAAYLAVWWLYRRGRRLEEQAAEAERMAYIGTLASGLAHEIRNPLNSLRLNMQMLEEDLDNPTLGTDRKILAITKSEIGRLERLATDFLSYARPRALDLERVRAVDVLGSAREVLAREIEAEGVTVTVRDETGGQIVEVDRSLMRQLLLNLLQNAVMAAASEGPGGSVALVARQRDETVVLEVTDDGPGIPRLEQAKIFDLFYSTRKGGTGLGLAIVKRIAQAHEADLSVVSAPGEGTTIGIALPTRRKQEAAEAVSRPVESRVAS